MSLLQFCLREVPAFIFSYIWLTGVNQLIKINHHCDFVCCFLLLLFLLLLFKRSREGNYAQLLAAVVGFRNRELPVPFRQKKMQTGKCRKYSCTDYSISFHVKDRLQISVVNDGIKSMSPGAAPPVASNADVLRGSSRVPVPRTSAELKDKFLSHCSQISAGDHTQIIGDPIGAVVVKVLTSQTRAYKLCRVWYVTKDFCSWREYKR